MIIWIERPLALAIHERQLAEHGGGVGVRDESLLESALARPQQLHACGDPPPDLVDLAASLAFDLARNHPFVDGNKRAAFLSVGLFLALNGQRLKAQQADAVLTMLAVASGTLDEAGFADWIRSHAQLR